MLDLSDPAIVSTVRRIFWARGHAARLLSRGLDPDDGLAEVYLGLVSRQHSPRSRWSPERGAALTTYVEMVCRSIVSHLLEGARAPKRARVLLTSSTDPDEPTAIDLAEADPVPCGLELADLAQELDLPVALVARLAVGEDPVAAALALGMDGLEAMAAGERWRLRAAGASVEPEVETVDLLDLLGL